MTADNPIPELALALRIFAQAIVDEPHQVEVNTLTEGRSTTFQLKVAPDDIGKLIGQGGRTARSLRILYQAAAKKYGLQLLIDIPVTRRSGTGDPTFEA